VVGTGAFVMLPFLFIRFSVPRVGLGLI
jgi:hypothetical protein